MKRGLTLLISLLAMCLPVSGMAQTSKGYDTLVQQGNAQLRAGTADQALTAGEQAIQTDPQRWEAYALAGGALMNLKRYDEATEKLNEAIRRAPEAKQSTLSELRRQCVAAGSSAAASLRPPRATATQVEVILWKSIENSSNPSDFQSYLDQYPNGAFTSLAQSKLQQAKEVQNKRKQDQQKLAQDSAWRDPDTGLMWTRQDNGRDVGFGEAADYCSHLQLLGFSNWQVPTYDQLKRIHSSSWTGRGQIRSDFQLSGGVGALWTSSHSGMGGYFGGKVAQSGYLIFPEKGKGDALRTLCVRNE